MATSKTKLEQAKELVYEYIRYLADCVPPDEAIEAFYQLMWDRVALLDEHGDMRTALTVVLQSPYERNDAGLKFINRSYYSICNRWHLDNTKRQYLDQLVGRLGTLPEPDALNPETNKLRGLLQAFNHSDYGDCLRRQMRLAGHEDYNPLLRQQTGTVADILPEHFCLYRSATLTEDLQLIERQSAQSWWETGIGSKQLYRLQKSSREVKSYIQQRQRGVTDIHNPTRLSQQDLDECLIFYHPKRKSGLNERAQQLRQQLQESNQGTIDYGLVHDYLMASIRPLPEAVYKTLRREMLTVLERFRYDVTKVMGNLITLFSNLLDAVFLPCKDIARRSQKISNINRLRRSIEHAGYMDLTGALLSITLPFPMMRFDLEKKLGYLYSYHEKARLEDVPWVVDFFEHMNLALVLNAQPLRYFPVVERGGS